MSPLLPNYLRTLRMQWGLTQPELASLLGISESALSKFETQSLAPTKNLILGVEVIFGKNARQAFPALYAQTERNIMRRAAAFSERLDADNDENAKKKRSYSPTLSSVRKLITNIYEPTSQEWACSSRSSDFAWIRLGVVRKPTHSC